MNIIVGSQVWVEDPALAWIGGYVIKINGEEAEIQRTDEKKVYIFIIRRLTICCCAFLSHVGNATVIVKKLFVSAAHMRTISFGH